MSKTPNILVSYLYWTKDLVLYRCNYCTFIIAHKNVYHNQAPHCIASDVFGAHGARQLRVVWFASSGVVGGATAVRLAHVNTKKRLALNEALL